MRIVIASDSAEERGRYRQAVLDAGQVCERADCVTVSALANRLRDGGAQAAIAAVGLDERAVLSAAHGAATCDVPFYAVCDRHDETLVPGLLRAGARGYLRRDSIPHDLSEMISELRAGAINVDWGKVIAIASGARGVGVTTIATNLAIALEAQHPRQVVLAQLANGASDLAIHLGLQPDLPLSDLATGWPRLGSPGLDRYLHSYAGGPMVLADQPKQNALAPWNAVSLRHLLSTLRSRFSFVVVDLGHVTDEARFEALRFADSVNLVLRLDAPTVMATRQFLVKLSQRGVTGTKLTGIVNRLGQPEQWTWPRARAALGIAINHWVPDDSASVNRAQNSRKPVMISASESALAESFVHMAATCHNGQTARQRNLAG